MSISSIWVCIALVRGEGLGTGVSDKADRHTGLPLVQANDRMPFDPCRLVFFRLSGSLT